MKTKEEQLKIYSAYLPYKTNVKTPCGQIRQLAMVDAEEHCVSMTESNGMVPIETVTENGSGFKLILYPLDMLTQEIEHEGEKFVPVERLEWKSESKVKIITYGDGSTLIAEYIMMGETFNENIMIRNSFENTPLWIVKKLLKWHFNVFNLSEDEFINKATIYGKSKSLGKKP